MSKRGFQAKVCLLQLETQSKHERSILGQVTFSETKDSYSNLQEIWESAINVSMFIIAPSPKLLLSDLDEYYYFCQKISLSMVTNRTDANLLL